MLDESIHEMCQLPGQKISACLCGRGDDGSSRQEIPDRDERGQLPRSYRSSSNILTSGAQPAHLHIDDVLKMARTLWPDTMPVLEQL